MSVDSITLDVQVESFISIDSGGLVVEMFVGMDAAPAIINRISFKDLVDDYVDAMSAHISDDETTVALVYDLQEASEYLASKYELLKQKQTDYDYSVSVWEDE
tara:strand:+ start:2800 stop:3108 length:309 start_codon:yes stop_codon:yes gene_type:complete